MKRSLLPLGVILFLLAIGSAWIVQAASPAPQKTTAGEDLSWNVVPAGGQTFGSGGTITLGSSIGQPLAGSAAGGDFTLETGWWAGTEFVGISELMPIAGSSPADMQVTFTLTWTHPQTWRALNTLDLRLRNDSKIGLWSRFSEIAGPNSTFGLLDANGQSLGAGVPGSATVLESTEAKLYLAQSSLVASGPDDPSVVLTFVVSFKPAAAGQFYRIELLATDDLGNTQGPDVVGTWAVGSFYNYLSLVSK